MTVPTDLERGALRAAREARREVAKLLRNIESEHPDLGAALSKVVATLFSAEVGDAARIHECLAGASDGLRQLLENDRWGTRDVVARGLSRSLALVHPAQKTLARALGRPETNDNTEPFLLTPSRIKASSPPPDGPERRAAQRAELEVAVGLEGNNRFYAGTTGDISTGGLFVATDTPLMVGTELVLSFVLPDGFRVSTDATVAWVRAPRYRPGDLPAGMGVRFEHLADEHRRALEHFLEERPPFRYGD